MALLASPKVRRRLSWIALILGGAGVLALVAVLLPNHGGPEAKPGVPSLTFTEPGETSPPVGSGPDAATERARTKAVATVRPLAAVRDRCDPPARSRGRTFAVDPGAGLALLRSPIRRTRSPLSVGSEDVAPPGRPSPWGRSRRPGHELQHTAPNSSGSILLAIRLRKASGRWLIDYLRQGHVSRSVSETNFSPSGFSPGSQSTSLSAWWPLLLGLLGLIVLVALVEFGLSGRRRRKG